MYTFINAASSDQFAYALMLMTHISWNKPDYMRDLAPFLASNLSVGARMELSLFHTELTPSEPPPTHSPPNVLPDHYIPDLSFDSDSDATV